MEIKLYVGNLADSTTAEELRLLFAQAGTVVAVDLMKDAASGESKGYAFVTMSTQAEAQTAIALFNAYAVADSKLLVKVTKSRPAHSAVPDPLNAFAGSNRQNASPRQKTGGYQGQLGAFGNGRNGPRRRGGGGSPRH